MSGNPENLAGYRFRRPVLAWVAWFIVVGLTLALVGANFAYRFDQLHTICVTDCYSSRLTVGEFDAFTELGISLRLYAGFSTALMIGVIAVTLAIAILIVWRRPRDKFALFVSAALVLNISRFFEESETVRSEWASVSIILLVLMVASLPILPLLFPDGRLYPRWARPIMPFWMGLVVYGYVALQLDVLNLYHVLASILDPFWTIMGVAFPAMLVLGAYAQFIRYRKSSTPEERQQTKWVVFGLIAWSILALVQIIFVESARPDLSQSGPPFATYPIVSRLLESLTIVLVPITLGVAILRYRLWDIDIIIRRTLIYSSLTATLVVSYYGSVIVLQTLFQSLAGGKSPLIIVVSTLLIAALFHPLRIRIQDGVDRRFFRRKYDAERVLASFARSARDEADLDALTKTLTSAVVESLQPNQVSVILRTGSRR